MAKKREYEPAPHLPEEAMEGVGGIQKIALGLMMGWRKPQNEEEEELLKEINEIRAKGQIVDLGQLE